MAETASKVSICEVGPRDGLQNQKRLYSAAERAALINGLAAAGLKHIEAVSFANPRLVPQMADAERVLESLDLAGDVCLAGLAMNLRGVERALKTPLHEIRYVVVASETFSQRNQNASVADTIARFEEAASAVREAGRRMTAVVAASFGCPFEGEVAAGKVADIVAQLIEHDPHDIVLADTIGVGVPNQVADLAGRMRPLIDGRRLGFHFHNTRNTGFANAWAAIMQGAEILDSSIGGLGGCPFAPGATGNIATEDLVYLLERSGIATMVDPSGLVAIANRLREEMPGALTAQIGPAGWFPPA
jgi:isopropylmalate/homocitrate/citramalate synthase